MGSVVVRAAIAVAKTIGDGRYPSLTPWCSQTTAARAPRLSDHSAISRAAAYRSVAGAPHSGARMSNRMRNIGGTFRTTTRAGRLQDTEHFPSQAMRVMRHGRTTV